MVKHITFNIKNLQRYGKEDPPLKKAYQDKN